MYERVYAYVRILVCLYILM